MMKYTKILLFTCWLLGLTATLPAQDWTVGGNNLGGAGATRLFGISGPNTKHLVFINGNSGGTPVERGRITNTGFWGIGTTAPDSRLHINGSTGQTPFRVQVNGSSKLYVNSNGGVSVGVSSTPPEDGLLVSGDVRVGTGTFANGIPMHVLGGTDAGPSTGGYIIAGSTGSSNLAIDQNGIMARNNGNIASLSLNPSGGSIRMPHSRLVIDADNNTIGVRTQLAVPETDFHIRHATGLGAVIAEGLRLENEGAGNEDWTLYTANNDGRLILYENNNMIGEFSDVSGAYSTVSDARLKKDIEKAPALLDKLLQLDIKKYRFLKNKPDDKKYYGMLAQEVEKIFPEMVTHNKQDNGEEVYMMDYAAFGVLAIKGLQEMQQMIAALKEQNENLESRLLKLENTRAVTGSTATDASVTGTAMLEQNIPNPFNQVTTIRYRIPQSANAAIIIYNSGGAAVKNIRANASGIATINAAELAAGAYSYNLVVNGKTVASKKMVLVK